jgi:hypothetical protein
MTFNIPWFIALGSEDNQLPMQPAKLSYAGQMKARGDEVCQPSMITCLFTQKAIASRCGHFLMNEWEQHGRMILPLRTLESLASHKFG